MANIPARDVAKLSQPSRSSSNASAKSPPVPERSQSMSKSPLFGTLPPLPPPSEGDSEARLQLVKRELEEARARAAQMEKTMRWWSDCTNNWREKWSKVRNEKNKVKEDCKHYRNKYDTTAKENISLKKERDELLEKLSNLSVDKSLGECHLEDKSSSSAQYASSGDASVQEPPKECDPLRRQSPGENFEIQISASQDFLSSQKIVALQFKLEEAQKLLETERQEKVNAFQSQEKLENTVKELEKDAIHLQTAKEEAESQLFSLLEQHENELGRVTTELADEFSSRSTMGQQLSDLRKELERLQSENAKEWGKRERLESDKLALERDNKRLSSEALLLKEELTKKNEGATAVRDGDLKVVQRELAERNKEVTELRHNHAKAKKLLQEKLAELEHAKSRADQYELEVKKLRSRVDELKQELAASEDEVDQQANQIRRLQRTNDELQIQCENLQVQLEHLNTRLRSASLPRLSSRSTSLKALNLNESTECPTTDDDV